MTKRPERLVKPASQREVIVRYLAHRLIPVICLPVIAACAGDATAPDLSSLNGDWFTGHSVNGLEAGLTLDWSARAVHGAGNYLVFDVAGHCPSGAPAPGSDGSMTFQASRPSPTQLSGSVSFDGGTPVRFEGALVDSSRINGSIPRIIGSLIADDGAECPLELFHAAVPIP